jgi:type I restriction-modification system DNA methylase subunit
MDRQAAVKVIKDTFENSFDKGRFINLSKNLVKYLDSSKNFTYQGNIIPAAYQQSIQTLERVGKYEDADDNKIDALIVRLKREHSLERARTMQRNFVAWYLNGSRGGELKDAALVAFVSPESEDWRFSLVRMDYNIAETPGGKVKVETELTPARRYSFLVGENESSHTAQVQLLPILLDDERKPLLSDFEKAFNIEVVTKEFFTKYRELFHDVEEALEDVIKQNRKAKEDFAAKGVDTVNFAKKLLGQIVFLYFLQKKGWFGVGRDEDWGDGPKDFLRRLFGKKIAPYRNFFNDVLEPLFYEALASERTDDFYSRFNCKIPFLNGGLFDPINNYDWVHTDILFPNELFSNSEKTKEGDTGTGILDVFDRYNFTVNEDEPLDKEVAIDPEMLGEVFENLLEVKDRKSKGTYYTPREIVHYMCQESLINYLDTAINTGEVPLVTTPPPQGKLFGKPDPEQAALKAPGYRAILPREDIEAFVRRGEMAIEHDTRVETYGKETERYSYKLPESIRRNAKLIDDKLAGIRICDPAIGSGAFPVGLMTEIVRARNTLTTYMPDKTGRTNYHFKRHAIQNCLYGVDIDPGAVEIAKLRLWLSLVVDEEDIKQIQPLPNLDYKIVCGNSLLGVQRDMFNDELFKKLEELKTPYFSETNAKKKQEYKKQIDQLINKITNNNETFDFEVYFSEVFHEKGGFDVVIANPPWVFTRLGDFEDAFKKFITDKYLKGLSGSQQGRAKQSGKINTFAIFILQGLRLLRPNGSLTYIIPNTLLRATVYDAIRKFFLDNCRIMLIADLSSGRFDNVTASTAVISLENVKSNGSHEVKIVEDFDLRGETRFNKIAQDDFLKNVSFTFSIFATGEVNRLIKKVESNGVRLDSYFVVFAGGIATGPGKKDYIANKPLSSKYKPLIEGKNVKKYRVVFDNKYILYDRKKLYRAREENIFLCPQKLITQRIGGSCTPLVVAYDDKQFYTFNSTNCILPKTESETELKYLLAILNSRLLNWYYYIRFANKSPLTVNISKTFLEQLPIKKADRKVQASVIALVDHILAITKDADYLSNQAKQARVKELEHQIDQMVYELYGLTPEEIAVVEGIH